MDTTPPDVIMLGAEWRERALLRAQLIEEGLEVVAIDAWPIPRAYRQTDTRPRVLVVDLYGLPQPREVLEEIRLVMPPGRVLVIEAAGTVDAEDVRRLGYQLLSRPIAIGDVVAAVVTLLDGPGRAG